MSIEHDKIIEKKFRTLVQEGKYKEAGYYIIDAYYLASGVEGKYTLETPESASNKNTSYALTVGELGKKQTIKMPRAILRNPCFGTIVRALKHELDHVFQKVQLLMPDHNEREFLAWYYHFFGHSNLPKIDITNFNKYKHKALKYYAQLPADKQQNYLKEYHDIVSQLQA